jgi:uncharacterized cupredoxin-like copper-binding protein
MPTRRHAVLYAVTLLAVAVVALSACGSSKSSTSSTTTATTNTGGPTNTGAPTTPAPTGTQVTVAETEFHLTLSTTTFTAGTYTIVADNKGTVEHSLAIKGPGVSATTTLLSPGQTADLHVTLQAGSYELWCPVDGHKALGMDTHITVTG